jgi:ABC-2 family transporter protein
LHLKKYDDINEAAMKDIIKILGLRLMILRRLAMSPGWTEWLKIIVVAGVCLILLWSGLGRGLAYLYKAFDKETGDSIVWIVILQLGVLLSIEGAIAISRKLYNHKENDYLLSLPIGLERFFWFRLVERAFFNLLIVVIAALAFIRQSRFADVVLQTQFTVAVLYSRRLPRGFRISLSLGFIIVTLIAAAAFLLNYRPSAASRQDILLGCLANMALILSTFVLRYIFVRSYYNEYKFVNTLRYGRRHPFHRLLSHPRIDNRIKALIGKDIVLLIRQWPIMQSVLTAAILAFLSAILFVQGGNNAVAVIGILGGFIIFAWAVLPFTFERKQSGCFWLLRSHPVTAREIWWSRYLFIMLLIGAVIFLFLIPMLIGGCTAGQITGLLGILFAQAATCVLLAVGLLYAMFPYYQAGEYLFAAFIVIGTVVGVSFPLALPVIFVPFIIMYFKRGIRRIDEIGI